MAFLHFNWLVWLFFILIGSCSASCGFCLFHLASEPFFASRDPFWVLFFFFVVLPLSSGFLEFLSFLSFLNFMILHHFYL